MNQVDDLLSLRCDALSRTMPSNYDAQAITSVMVLIGLDAEWVVRYTN